jgi:peptidoglycan/xylan/chitin deacetylase (PgdA/CDA1 family)
MPADAPLFIALTADVDPDANRAVAGRADAATSGDPAGAARTDACLDGLRAMLRLLHDASLPATLFWEGRTLDELAARAPDLIEQVRADPAIEHGCHGWRHEDFAGLDSGLPLGPAETRQALDAAGRSFRRAFGRAPAAFRAPYCRLTPHLVRALSDLGYIYDASETRVPSSAWPMRPYRIGEGGALWELALTRGSDRSDRRGRRNKPISCYLWQLFEGRRPVRDYVELAASLRVPWPGGLLQIALHPWHLIVSEHNRPLPAGEGVRKLTEVLGELSRLEGLAFTTARGYLRTAMDA